MIQGDLGRIKEFINDIRAKKPEIGFIEDIKIKKIQSSEIFSSLKIEKSEQGRGISLTLPPDIAICDNCVEVYACGAEGEIQMECAYCVKTKCGFLNQSHNMFEKKGVCMNCYKEIEDG